MLRVADAMESRYIRRTLSLPSPRELLKTCASDSPTGFSSGKYSLPKRTFARVLIQLSVKAACICATAGPSSW